MIHSIGREHPREDEIAESIRKDFADARSGGSRSGERITLSLCIRCRDGREDIADNVRGGARLAAAVMRSGVVNSSVAIRGVHCMSQCKKPCVVAVSGPGRFTYFFGDLDPTCDAAAVAALAELYQNSPDGFMARDARPEPMRAGVIGRLPPLGWSGEAVEIVDLTQKTNRETPE